MDLLLSEITHRQVSPDVLALFDITKPTYGTLYFGGEASASLPASLVPHFRALRR
jgi:hypothetical protein